MPTKSKKTIIRSFRISEESFNVLEEEAALLNVSVNTLVDQIIGVHTSYERFMKKFGMMRMARSTFRRLLEILPEDRVTQAAKQHMKEMGVFLRNLCDTEHGIGICLSHLLKKSSLRFVTIVR
jgi:hypothetical protein